MTLTFQSGIVRIWAHIKLSPFYYKANAITGVFYAYTAVCSVNSSYLFSRTKQERNCWNNYLIKSAMYLLTFHQNAMIFEGSPNFHRRIKTVKGLIHQWIRTGGVLNLGSLNSSLQLWKSKINIWHHYVAIELVWPE